MACGGGVDSGGLDEQDLVERQVNNRIYVSMRTYKNL